MEFEFEPRESCVCGAAIAVDAHTVAKRYAPGVVRFRRCGGCGSFVQSPRLTTVALARWYDSPAYRGGKGAAGAGYLDYMRGEAQRGVEARRRVRRDLAPHLPPGARVLEVGAATGSLLEALRRVGHVPVGCDLSSEFVAAARRLHGLDVALADWLDLPVADASLDAIVLLGTFPNLADPGRCLAAARRQLRPDGFLFFNFPAADSLPARLYGERMWMFTPSVMQFPTSRGVALALERAGFRVEAMDTDRQSPSLAKIAGHARLGFLHPVLSRLGLAEAALPLALPLPGIVAVRARPA